MWAPFCVSFSQQKKKMPNAFAAVTIVARYFLLFLRLFLKKLGNALPKHWAVREIMYTHLLANQPH